MWAFIKLRMARYLLSSIDWKFQISPYKKTDKYCITVLWPFPTYIVNSVFGYYKNRENAQKAVKTFCKINKIEDYRVWVLDIHGLT